jgi:hypothetical protein
MKDIQKIQEFISKSLKEYRQSSQATRDSWLKTEKPERFLILDPDGNALSTPLGKLKTDASIRALHTRLRRDKDGWFINDFKNTPLAIYDTKNKEVVEVMYRDDNNYWQFAFNIASLGDNKQFTYMFDITPKNLDNQNETMNDIKKIQEFFSKSLEEATFKKGDKITYLDYPGEITGVSTDTSGRTYYSVSYNKDTNTGRRTARGIYNKGGEIKLAEAKKETGVDMAKKQLDALGVKYEMSKTDKVRPFKVIYKPINKEDDWYDKFEEIVDLFNLKGFVKQSMSESLTAGYPHRKTSGEGFEKIVIAEPMDDATRERMIRRFEAEGWDAKPNFGGGITAVKKTLMNEDFAKFDTLKMAINQHEKGEPYYDKTRLINIFNQLDNPDQERAKKEYSEYFGKSVNESNGFTSGKQMINIKLKNYPKAVAKVNQLIDMIDEDKFDDKITNLKKYTYTLNGKKVTPEIGYFDHSLKAMISTPRSGDEYFDYEFYRIGEPDESGNIELSPEKGKKGMYTEEMDTSGFKSGKEFINIKLQKYPKAVAKINQLISIVGESNFTMEMAEWLFDFFNNASYESPVNEAKSEDKVDTITMDIPLFLRMLEYSREDAEQDLDLHDVTEKANKLGKERGILQMDDYEEIVGAAEEIQEIEDDQFKNDPWKGGSEYKEEDLLAQKIFGIKYFNWLDAWEQSHLVHKYNLDRSIITKEGKAAPYGSGYKPLEEKIAEALKSINEELCPAGKAYIKRRKAAGEKSSAYLSGRAVKVCKGQMSGKSKKK